MSVTINVVAGHGKNREVVGTIEAHEGLRTNEGVIQRVTKGGTVFVKTKDGEEKSFRKTDNLTVLHSAAVLAGYPEAEGCTRFKVRSIKRSGQLIEA